MTTFEKLRDEYQGMSDYGILIIADVLRKAASSPNGRLEEKPGSRLQMGYLACKAIGLMVDYQITEEGRRAYKKFQSAGVYSDFDKKMRTAHIDVIESMKPIETFVIKENGTVEK